MRWAATPCLVLAVASASVAADLPAFPGAQGYGAAAKGGRGGRVVHVTNLKDSGQGSFRAALLEKGPRHIVFDVGGTIELQSDLRIPRGHGFVTIAGQTAPGGVTLVGAQLWLAAYGKGPETTDIVMRHMRVRGLHNVNRPGQGGDCLDLYKTERVIVDHCSFVGSADETIDTSGSDRFTFQWCTIEESCLSGQGGAQHTEDSHNLGIIISFNDKTRATLHHNLFAHHKYRMPAFYKGEVCDFRNNIVYNWRSHAGTFQASVGSNIVGNTYVQGPNNRGDNQQMFYRKQGNGFYFQDNAILPKNPPPAKAQTLLKLCKGNEQFILFNKPVAGPIVTTQPCAEGYRSVLGRAGAWPRDTTTRRTVNEVKNRSGQWGLSGPYERFSERVDGPTSAKHDRDRDGMPDAWEAKHGLNPADPSDANGVVPAGKSPDNRHVGYTWVEYYLNETADWLVAAPTQLHSVSLEIQGPGRVFCVHSGKTPKWRSKSAPQEVDWGKRHVFNQGSRVMFKALPAKGKKFVGWSGAASGTGRVLRFQVIKDSKIVAKFK